MTERTVLACDQCGREGDEFTIALHVENRLTTFGERPEADFCTYACLVIWGIAEQDRKVAAK